jgi:outer membrane receptor protein involved in Fe transport
LDLTWKWLKANASVTWMQARDRSLTDGAHLPYTPDVLLAGGLSAVWRGWQLGSNYRQVSFRYSSLQNDAFSYLPSYALADVYVSYTKNFLNTLISFKLSAENAADFSYVVLQGYPMPGRRFRLQTTVYL